MEERESSKFQAESSSLSGVTIVILKQIKITILQMDTIEKILNLPYTESERIVSSKVSTTAIAIYLTFARLIRFFPKKKADKISSLLYRIKNRNELYPAHHEKADKAFGYYMNQNSGELIVLLNRLKISHLLDLGSGPGFILESMARVGYSTGEGRIYSGIENEKTLVEMANQEQKSMKVRFGDILKITEEDLKTVDGIYWWTPLIADPLCIKFAKNLIKILSAKQYVIVNGKDGMYYRLKELGEFDEYFFYPYTILKLKSK